MSRNSVVLCCVFFLSGAAALLFETLWFRFAGLAFGNSVWASALTLSAFMAGLAIGNGLAARHGHRFVDPVRLYALVEIVVAVSGVTIVIVLPSMTEWLTPLFRPLIDDPWLLNPLRLVLSFVVLTIPATAMGLTLPLLVKALHRSSSDFGATLGVLYGWNTMGAVAGALIGELFVIEWFGVLGAAYCAAGFNVVAALGAVVLARGAAGAVAGEQPTPERTPLSGRARRLLGGAFLSGAILLALEIVWFRFLQLFFPGTSLTFAIMLSIVLAGIAVGGLLVWAWFRITNDAHRFTGVVALASGVVTLGAYLTFSLVLESREHAATTGFGLEAIVLSMWLMFPVCVLSGVLFSLIGHVAHGEIGSETRSTGLVTMANTVGATLGPLLAGFFLVPRFGMETSFWVLGALYGAVAWAVSDAQSWRTRLQQASGGLLLVVVAVFLPASKMDDYIDTASEQYRDKDTRVMAVREGLTETIQYLQTDYLGHPLSHRLVTNSFSMAGTTWGAKRYMKFYVYWPVAVHPDPKNALLISYGTASTAKALTDTPSLEHIDVVDISKEILEMGDILFEDPADSPLKDPRVTTRVEDGRFFLQVTERRYDIITSEPPPPKHAGVVNLYTQEYFQLCHDRLAEGGVVTYWLPVYETDMEETQSIVRAFLNVFEDTTLWSGRGFDWMLVGTRGLEGPVSDEQFAGMWLDLERRRELVTVGLERPELLGTTFIMGSADLREWTRDSKPLSDWDPKQLGWRLGAGRLLLDEYAKIMDTKKTRERFASSPEVKRWWPARFYEATQKQFWVQDIINTQFYPVSRKDRNKAKIGLGAKLHRVLTRTRYRAPILWEYDIGEPVLNNLAKHEGAGKKLDARALRFKSVGFLAGRKYEEAEQVLAQIENRPDFLPDRVFYLCLADKYGRATALVNNNKKWFQDNKGMPFLKWLGTISEFDVPEWVP